MSRARLYIITDNAERAAERGLGCRLADLPGWVRMLATPGEISALPNGAKTFGFWFSKNSPAEFAWQDRRARGGFQAGLTGEELDALNDWIARRDAQPSVPAAAAPVTVAEKWL